jgi:polyhydroxybutyrate depolymerase
MESSRNEIVMKRFLRFLRLGLYSLIVVVALLGALFAYYVYTPAAQIPRLSGTLTRQTIQVDGRERIYRTYVPQGLAKGAPLVVVMHGSGQNGVQMREETGYGFDRLADEHGFAVLYPNAYDGDWNACNIVGNYIENKLNIDDVGFLTGLVDKLVSEMGIDPDRVFATGSSRGGSMALRLALEAPSRFRAIAAVSANEPTPDNSKCKPAGQGTSVMIMNGTQDPLVPFDGGQDSLFGIAYISGTVRSSRESVQYFADLDHIAGTPETKRTGMADGIQVERVLWRNDSKVEVELVAVHGAGHGMPQPYQRRPRILGPSAKEPNGPAVIWEFFERQRR